MTLHRTLNGLTNNLQGAMPPPGLQQRYTRSLWGFPMARTTLLGTGDPGSPLHHLARNRECLVLLFEKAWAEEVR